MNSIVSGSLYTVVCNSGWKVVVQVLLMRKFGILSFVLGVKRWQTAIAATASFNGYVIWMVRPLFLCHKWPLCSFSCSMSTKSTLMRSKTVETRDILLGCWTINKNGQKRHTSKTINKNGQSSDQSGLSAEQCCSKLEGWSRILKGNTWNIIPSCFLAQLFVHLFC